MEKQIVVLIRCLDKASVSPPGLSVEEVIVLPRASAGLQSPDLIMAGSPRLVVPEDSPGQHLLLRQHKKQQSHPHVKQRLVWSSRVY